MAEPARIPASLGNITTAETSMSPRGYENLPPAYLLAFDQAGTGRIIVSWGDPDQADTTVTYVPGLSTNLSNFGGDIDRAGILWDQASRTASGKKIASIAWLDYDAPQIGDIIGDSDRSVAFDK